MAKLWQVGGGLHPLVEAYTIGEDYRIDGELMLPYDIIASKAHASGLQSIGVLTEEELKTLHKALDEIDGLWKEGKFKVTVAQEDGHTAIEQYITEKYGEVGKKIHTGRSRNDQSVTMIRLFAKDRVGEIRAEAEKLSAALKAKSSSVKSIPMPGYTHMQKAMPATVGMWLDSFSCAFADTFPMLDAALKVLDQNPLGSAAGFGINGLALNRALTAEKMGFHKVQENPMYCGFSRGLFENVALQAMGHAMVVCSRFAVDMMMFTQQEFSFFSLSEAFVTGSSIMPQKKNYDLFEIMRANGRVFNSLQMQVQQIITGLGSGYHRDLQITKKAFADASGLCLETLKLLNEAVPQLEIHEAALKAAMTEELFVTDEVYKRVAKGEAFREAYGTVKAEFMSRKRKAPA
mmetsp:Transcript_7901/g.17449  ORF Transcript_7901/g.17449 Transcript_7901/m.17449 type:complete len:404 (-) Transcript_7901:53-1264(-)